MCLLLLLADLLILLILFLILSTLFFVVVVFFIIPRFSTVTDVIQADPSVSIMAKEPEEEARTQSCISIEKGRYSL